MWKITVVEMKYQEAINAAITIVMDTSTVCHVFILW